MNKMFSFCIGLSIFLTTTSCQSQALLPYSDLEDIRRGRSILSTYTCEDLIEKATDKSFSLKNLAGLRAMAKCPEFKFDMNQLTEIERRLYASEIESFNTEKTESKRNDMSVKALKAAIKTEKNPDVKFAYYKTLRAQHKRETSKANFLQTTTELYNWAVKEQKKKKPSSSAAKNLYEATQIYARTMWTEEKTTLAVKAIEDSIAKLAKTQSVAELYYLEGRIEEEAQDFSEAVAAYDKTIADMAQHKPEGLTFDIERVMWLKAWIEYKQKKFAEAEAAFQALINATQDLSEKSRAQFYRARALKNLDREAEARALLETIAINDYFGYYGLVSYHELGRKLPALKSLKSSNSIKFDLKLDFLPELHRQTYKDLIKYREFNIAEKAIPILSASKNDEVNLALYIAQRAQIFMPIFRQFSRLNNNEKLDVFIAYPELIFPQPYSDHVTEMAQKTKIPSSLIYSIMKQESAFNERARSHADAIGLMQVIPGLAKQLSRKFEVPYRHQVDLYDPLINIQLGSYELMEQVRKQNGQLTYVAAAYNAGPNALSNWLKNRKRDDVLEFIEEIPYDETKTYVKLIARNKLFYERISNRDVEHDFPSDFLN